MALKGIDVSYANYSVDWAKAKNDIDFAILRSSFGSDLPSQTDSQYHQNAIGCIKNNIPFGIYHFAYFVDETTAKNEANFSIRLANTYKDNVKFIALDIEEDSERYAKRVGKNPDWQKCAITFMETIKKAGYTPILYTNIDWMENKLGGYEKMKSYKIWFAGPDASAPKYNAILWQYSWKGKVSGINGDVDMNYLYDSTLIHKKDTSNTATNSMTSNDKEKFLSQARTYIGKNGAYVCLTKLGLGQIYDWCAFAVSAIMKDCGFIGKYQAKIYSFASDNAREDHDKYGEWFLKGSKAPQPGDLIMFRYSSLSPIDKYSASHVGIVEAVNKDIITTLEGNVEGQNNNWAATSTFKRKTRYLNDSSIYSFFRFYWKTSTTTSSAPKETEIGGTDSAKKVNYSVTVTAKDGVNIRNYPTTSGKIIGAIPYGETIKIIKQTGGSGYTWGLTTYNNVKGWIATDFTKKISPAIKKGDKVKVNKNATVYGTTQKLSNYVYTTTFIVMEVSGNRVVIGNNGQVTAAIDKKYLTKI